ncbi:MAG TPA: 3-hydroxyacyl-CoA dehydrogenase NAD-binding domain-containing protein [Pusillimonas sp.]|uniref:3-hydroxyacyl-CoA dehydrogenase NAD-binding domain-containing protein n=1 Tax=unclassified Pusillimonas TaxID=2640016 RepID=UPI00262D1ED0|nr:MULTISPECIES: 3-hydroxyacyl-CoA dehydrogenase NAD-binding domain-containing protein [unclassified Pusillimonas]HLU18655.1 3-hydroxyacyl-CoA dehydrogenase NAD-binding domain-containing protein [Pusillimonas sp.]
MRQEIKRVAVIGTGVIGSSWAAYFLARGLDVIATDPMPDAETRLRETVARLWPTMQAIGVSVGASLDRLRFETDMLEAVKDADFVQENGPEEETLKIDLFQRMDSVAPADVVLASSSSGLLISKVQSACKHPERVVLGHPFNPPHLIPLVEVIGGDQTSQAALKATIDFYSSIGKSTVNPRKEVKGHIANRLQAALWREAFYLVEQGVATVHDIDVAISHGPGLRWSLLGPFMNLHLSGGQGGIEHMLEHLGGPIQDWWDDLGSPTMTPDLKRKVATQLREVLASTDESRFLPERDRILLELIAAKKASGKLP